MVKIQLFFYLTLLINLQSLAQKEIRVDQISDVTFSPKRLGSINWMKDGDFYTALTENKIIKYSIKTGKEVEVLVDGEDLALKIDDYSLSMDESKMLILSERDFIYRRSYTGIYFAYDLTQNKLVGKVDTEPISYATFTPQGTNVAYVKTNNLYVSDLEGTIVQVTSDGEYNKIINGSADWVYEEELYLTKAFEWSPDGNKIAYYRFDESRVKEYTMQLWNERALYPENYTYKYPKAGEANAHVQIWIYNLVDQSSTQAQIGNEKDLYIPRIQWSKDPNILSVTKLNRLQNKLEIIHVNANNRTSQLIIEEQSDTYIDFTFCSELIYLENGKELLLSSEKSGYKQFYKYDLSGNLINKITSGEFEAEGFVGINEERNKFYYTSTEDTPLERHLYEIGLDGKGKKKLTVIPGLHRIDMSPDTRYFIDYLSSTTNPLTVDLYKTTTGKKLKSLVQNQELVSLVKEYGFVKKELIKIPLKSGGQLDASVLKPRDFDASKKYPVLVYQYSGPGSQQVVNTWGGRHDIWHQLLLQKGFIVMIIDPRGTGGKGERYKKITYKQLGKIESEDLIEAGRYLQKISYIDPERLGIWGWSFGGYMSSLVLFKASDVFRAAIAVAPVTSWRFYDTIYTERYLQKPQDNPTGYDDNSPITYAKNLRGRFLLIHGTGDDNVHFGNSVALQENLIKNGKQFDSFYYPDLAHSLDGDGSYLHLYQMMTDFLLENL